MSWWLHQMETFSGYWPFLRGIHRLLVNSPHKGQWRGALMFPSICAWINGWVKSCEAGDLRRHRTQYNVTVMIAKWQQYSYGACFFFPTGLRSTPPLKNIYCHQTSNSNRYNSTIWMKPTFEIHDDVIKWKHFPRYWPFVRGIHRSRWIPRTKASDTELWCLLWSAPELTIEQTTVRLVIWDAISIIMTSA